MTERPGLLRRMDDSGIPSLLARLIGGGYVAYLGYLKLDEPVHFLKLINQYDMIPDGFHVVHNLMVVILPWLEIVGGLALVAGVLVRGTAAVLAGLVAMFTVVIFLRAMHVVREGQAFFEVAFDCGCGGGPEIIWIKLFKNLALIVLMLWLLYAQSRRFGLSGLMAPVAPAEPEPDPAGS